MSTYPTWSGDPALEPQFPDKAWVLDEETGEYELVYPYINVAGQEVNDPTPMEPPLGYKEQPSIAQQIRDMVRSEQLRLAVEAEGYETFEEADDFDVGDDFDPTTPYENDFDPPIKEVVEEVAKARKEQSKGENKEPVRQDPQPKEPVVPEEQEENES